jgi:hypothetical protein
MFIRAAGLVETVLRGVALDERERERERVFVCVDRCSREMTSMGFIPTSMKVILDYKAKFMTNEKFVQWTVHSKT